MINKLELQSVINKYFLNGMVESVKWTTENNALDIDFQSPNKDMIGRVKHTNFPLENSVIAVYDTSKLNKLLGITSGEVVLELEKTQAVYTKLIISDFNYTLNPSAIKAGTSGSYIDAVTGSEFRPYATTVGIYNDADELLVVGKLSTPYPIPPNTDMTFVIRWDS